MLEITFPKLRDKIVLFYNILDAEMIKRLAFEKTNEVWPGVFKIVTVGRLTSEKQPIAAINVAAMLDAKGYDYVWVWVGEGNQRQASEALIRQFGLERKFVLAGNQLNPYVYMKHCDLYVQPSEHEAFCTTTNEARIIGKSIVATNCSGMDEQIIDGVTGYIVDNDCDAICEKIAYLIDHKDALKEFEENISKTEFKCSGDIDEYVRLFSANDEKVLPQ